MIPSRAQERGCLSPGFRIPQKGQVLPGSPGLAGGVAVQRGQALGVCQPAPWPSQHLEAISSGSRASGPHSEQVESGWGQFRGCLPQRGRVPGYYLAETTRATNYVRHQLKLGPLVRGL